MTKEMYNYRFRATYKNSAGGGTQVVDVVAPLGRIDKAWEAAIRVLKARDKVNPGYGLTRYTTIERTN